MGVNVNWFKTCKIREYRAAYSVVYDGDDFECMSVSYTNRTKLQETIERITGKVIPTIDEYYEFNTPEDIYEKLIKPEELSSMMDKVLSSEEMIEDKDDIKDRIEFFKKLSDDGFYITFDAS